MIVKRLRTKETDAKWRQGFQVFLLFVLTVGPKTGPSVLLIMLLHNNAISNTILCLWNLNKGLSSRQKIRVDPVRQMDIIYLSYFFLCFFGFVLCMGLCLHCLIFMYLNI
jgi:hypothetical protein